MEERLQQNIRTTRRRARFFGIMGILIGVMILYVNPTYFSLEFETTCGYWFFWFIATGTIFMVYLIFIKLLVDSVYIARNQTYYMMHNTVGNIESMMTYFEAFLIGATLFLISGSFFVFAAKCYFEQFT